MPGVVKQKEKKTIQIKKPNFVYSLEQGTEGFVSRKTEACR
jgi:hypothetical protein